MEEESAKDLETGSPIQGSDDSRDSNSEEEHATDFQTNISSTPVHESTREEGQHGPVQMIARVESTVTKIMDRTDNTTMSILQVSESGREKE